ncbi:MAG: aminotransferase class V-fold PLP-dependent enzyme [Phycisphaerales bacterium]
MPDPIIYLDNAATSWPKPDCVGEAMVDFLTHRAGNPGRGGHRLAREASLVLEQARDRLTKLVHAPCPQRMILTHGCTDALNLAIHGVLRADIRTRCDGTKPHVVTTAIEHNAVLRTLHCYTTSGLIDMTIVPCDEQGFVHADALIEACNECTVLLTLSHASNVLGTIQPIKETIRTIREQYPDMLIMVDAAQTAGHFEIDVQDWDIDLLPLAGHKGLRGPTGTGALYVSPRAYPDDCDKSRVFCERRGGTGSMAPGLEMPTKLPDALEAGTSNAVGFAGLIAAIDALTHEVHEHEMEMTDRVLRACTRSRASRSTGCPASRDEHQLCCSTSKGPTHARSWPSSTPSTGLLSEAASTAPRSSTKRSAPAATAACVSAPDRVPPQSRSIASSMPSERWPFSTPKSRLIRRLNER